MRDRVYRQCEHEGVSLSTTCCMDVQGVSIINSADSVDVQGVSLSTASSVDMQGVSLPPACCMHVQGVSIYTITSVDVQGVNLSTASSKEVLAGCILLHLHTILWNAGPYGIRSIRYRNE
jgi:hypothetical protein